MNVEIVRRLFGETEKCQSEALRRIEEFGEIAPTSVDDAMRLLEVMGDFIRVGGFLRGENRKLLALLSRALVHACVLKVFKRITAIKIPDIEALRREDEAGMRRDGWDSVLTERDRLESVERGLLRWTLENDLALSLLRMHILRSLDQLDRNLIALRAMPTFDPVRLFLFDGSRALRARSATPPCRYLSWEPYDRNRITFDKRIAELLEEYDKR